MPVIRLLLTLSLAAVAACETENVGKPCGTQATAVPNPVGGENPTVEVVRVERDGNCESLQCLTHLGIAPYCTRNCELETPPYKQRSCSNDDQCRREPFSSSRPGHCVEGKCRCLEDRECKPPYQCVDGQCRDDDCPSGFWCKIVQEDGPVAGERFCVRRTGCADNVECEDVGTIACQHLGCRDACLTDWHVCHDPDNSTCNKLDCFADCLAQGGGEVLCRELKPACGATKCYDACVPQTAATCTFHRRVCEPLSNLDCSCWHDNCTGDVSRDNISVCRDEELYCQPDPTAPAWTCGSVRKLDVCVADPE